MTSTGSSASAFGALFYGDSSPFGSGILSEWNITDEASNATLQRRRILREHDRSDVYPSGITHMDGAYYISFGSIARFEICFARKCVTVFDIGQEATEEALGHFLFDHVAPRILAGGGELVLHASAVEIDGRLAVFLGETGAGKSTLAASLHRLGHRLVGDDAAVIGSSPQGFTARSVYPSLRLYEESISAVLGEGIASAPMAHYSEKKRLDLQASAGGDSCSVPLGAFFFLVDEETQGTVASHPLSPGLTCMGLVEHSFALDPNDAHSAANRMRMASEVAQQVAGYELSYPWDFELLPEVHHEVLSRMHAPQAFGHEIPCENSPS